MKIEAFFMSDLLISNTALVCKETLLKHPLIILPQHNKI
jgi:hypothetical protein